MKAFVFVLIIATMLGIGNFIQSYRLDKAKTEIRQLTMELDTVRASQRADRETFAMQIKLIREANANANNAHKELFGKAGLSDAEWLADVLGSMWTKDGNHSAVPAGMDAGTVQGAGSNAGTVTGKDPAAVQRGNDPQGN